MKTIKINYFTPTGIASRLATIPSTIREELEFFVEEFEQTEAVIETIYDGSDVVYQGVVTLAEVAASI